MDLPTKAEEYTQFALEYSGKAYFGHPALKTFMAYFIGSIDDIDYQILQDEVHEWIIHTIKAYPEFVSVSAIHNEIECHVSIKICGVQITACNISELYPSPKNPYWQAGYHALALHRKRGMEQT